LAGDRAVAEQSKSVRALAALMQAGFELAWTFDERVVV
jgi:hypothetical protein